MDFLIKAYWYQALAHKLGIKVTNAQVQKALATAKKGQFSTAAQFQAFLTRAGRRCRTSCSGSGSSRSTRSCWPSIRPRSRRRRSPPTTATTSRSSARPRRRNLKIVLTKTRPRPRRPARRCRRAELEGRGQEVLDRPDHQEQRRRAHRRHQGPAGRGPDRGGLLGAEEQALGPVKGQFGYYVLEVTKITPATQQDAGAVQRADQADADQPASDGRPERGRQPGQEGLAEQDHVPRRLRDGRLQRLQGAQDRDDARGRGRRRSRRRRRRGWGHRTGRSGRRPRTGDRPRPPARPAAPQPLPRSVAPEGSEHDAADALARLDAITRRLRRECPWDREQDERSIVPHTVEEAYELADAAHRRDDAKLLDELGDVLFQVHFLSLLLEERGAGDLAAGGRHVTEKLIRRHPHVFGEMRGRHRRRGAAQLGRDQARRARTRAGRVRRGAREPALAAARPQGPAPGRLERV